MARTSDLSPAKRALLERALSGSAHPAPAARIPRRVEGAEIPLSRGQEQVWFFSRLSPELGVYNEGATVGKRGPVDLEALRRAFNEVLRRHEIWRTCFPTVEGRPLQRVLPHSDLELPLTDLTGLPAGEREPEAVRLATEDARAPYDLARGPLVRPRLVRLAEDDHRLYLALNHIVFDGVSLYRVLLPEMVSLYEAYAAGREPELPEPDLQYGDFAVWEREQERTPEFERRLDHWRRQLGGELPGGMLPLDHERPPAQRFRGAVEHLEIPREIVLTLKALALREGASLFMVLSAAFTELLHRYSGSDDVLFGTPVDGRGRPEMTSMLGFCLNAVVLRAEAGGDPSFTELVGRLRQVTLTAMANEVPFEQLVRELQPERDLSRNPLFQVMFGIEPPAPEVDPDWSIHQMDVGVGTAKFDLYLEQDERPEGHISCRLVYDTDLFEAATVARLGRHWLRLLEGVASDPGRRLSELRLLEGEERRRVLEEWNRTEAGLPAGCTHELIAEQARRTPQARAVEFEGRSLSYEELEAAANRLAHHLRGLGVGPDVLVGLCVERSLEMLVGVLGIWKAGGAYVPLDPGFPGERLRYMLEDSGTPVLVTQRSLQAELGLEAAAVVCLDDPAEPWAACSELAPQSGSRPSDLAYVIYTSGSTGRPKGVEIEHRALVNFLESVAREPGLGPEDVLVAVTTLSFDIAGLELYLPLLRGGRVVVASREVAADGRRLGALLESSRGTVLQATPASWRLLLESGWEGARGLTALCGGEALSEELAEQLLGRVGRLYNMYGPTETTIWSTLAKVEAGKPLRIGRPLQNTRVYVLDGRLEPVPVGVAGELYIGGAGLARGYRGRPELTRERFVPSPFGEGERLYRTGDGARWRPEGELEYLGRLDQQVKVRGFRIEPGEIEAQLERRPEVTRAVVVARELGPGDKRLVAYVVAEGQGEGEGLEAAGLKAELRRRLPEYMVPSAFVFLEELPLTPNGKVDRKALPAPELEGTAGRGEFQGPEGELEGKLAGIWAEVLGLERVDRRADFFELGGHSLLATRLAARVREALGVELPLRSFFEARSLAAMAALVAAREQDGGLASQPELRRRTGEGPRPLSFSQQRLWFLDQLEPENRSYHIPLALRLEGELNEAALTGSIQEIVRRHDVLRTTFVSREGEPEQVVAPEPTLAVERHDLSGLDEAEREEAASALLSEQVWRRFDLAAGPVLRAALVRLGPTDHLLVVVLHHIVADGWSLRVLVEELERLYAAALAGERLALPEPELQYADYAEWQQELFGGDVLEEELRYWRERLAGLSSLELPTDRPRPPVQSFAGGIVRLEVPPDLTGALRALGGRQGCSLYVVLLTAFEVLLARHTGQQDIAVGSVIANRQRRELEQLVGYFASTVVLRTDLGGDPALGELLARVRETTLEAHAHQGMPFDLLVQELQPKRDLSRNPLFQVLFSLDAATPPPRLDGLRSRLVEPGWRAARGDLSVFVSEGPEQVECLWEYSSDLFDRETVARLGRHWLRLLEEVASDPERRLSELRLLEGEERRRVLEEWNRTDAELPAACTHELIAEQARRTPQARAVEFEGRSLSYEELEAAANRLAHHLRALGVGPGVLVGHCVERSLEMLVGVLGIWKAGGAYVPLDPGFPGERLRYMLEDSGARVLVTQQRLRRELGLNAPAVVCLDAPGKPWARLSRRPPESGSRPSDLAYVIYTSGSTGRPKGVEIEHRGLVNLLTSMAREPGMSAADAFVAVTTLSFDMAGPELYLPLLWGGRVVVASREVAADGRRLGALLESSRGTVLQATPASWRLLLESGWRGSAKLTGLCGGEALSEELAEQLLGRVGRLYNMYGPTETTIWSTLAKVEAGKPLRIGRPLQNTRVYVLDGRLEPVPVGVAGELYIGGAGLARGYRGRPELTRERFVASPFGEGERLYRTGDGARWRPEGELEYLGRLDQQVKVRGFRIEPGEIEAQLERRPEVTRAVVVARELGPGDKRLVAYVVAEGQGEGEGLEAAGLKAELRRRLPEYMVPSAFVFLEELPLTPNGKVDRKALPAPELEGTAGRGEFQGPEGELEGKLAGIWAEVLGLERVDRRADFFELGGHSLLATRLAARVREALGVELPLRSFFEARSLAAMAALVGGQAGPRPPQPPAPADGQELSYSQRRLWFLSQLRPKDPAPQLALSLRIEGALVERALLGSLTEIARRHQVLRSVFVAADGEPVQRVLQDRPLELRRLQLEGLPEEARPAAADSLVRREAGRPFDLAADPPLRVLLGRLGPEEHLLVLLIHEIAADDRSLDVLLGELEALYPALQAGEPSPLPEPPLQHFQHACRERERVVADELADQVRYWRWRLHGVEATELPTDRPRPPVRSFRGATVGLQLAPELVAGLAPSNGAAGDGEREAALAAAFAALLSSHGATSEVAIGRTVSNRPGAVEEAAIGPFANTPLLRVDLGGDPTFRELVNRVKEMMLEQAPNQELPFEVLVDDLHQRRDLSRSPLFQLLFSYGKTPTPPRLPELSVSLRTLEPVTSKVDLALSVRDGAAGVECDFQYDTALFARETVERLAGRFRGMLEAAAQAPDVPLSQLPLLTARERAELEADWEAARHEFPSDASIADLFEEQVRKRPGAVALEHGDQRLTYRLLEARANQLAHRLLELGAGPQSLCGICLPRSADLVVAILGVLKAGAAYLPLDPSYPVERLDLMLRDAEATVLLTHERVAGSLTDRMPNLDVSTVLLDSGSPLIACQPEVPPDRPPLARELAYVIYTSGSTGKPKGVMIEHHAVVNHLLALQRDYGIGEADTVLQLPSLAFHPSVRDILGTLCAGARLVLLEDQAARDPRAIVQALDHHRVSCLLSLVPSLGRALVAEPGGGSLRLVLTCGESLRSVDARGLRDRFGCQIANQFGPTECVMAAAKHTFGAADEQRPTVLSGRAEANARLYILDAERRLLPAGMPGELYVGGESLARGYLGAPELTAERFLPDLFSPLGGARMYRTGDMVRRLPGGELEFLGRFDDQVKVRGFRVELGEVEATLAAHPGLLEAAVAVRGEKLAAYFVPRRAPGPSAHELRAFLKERLPDYMVPALYMDLEELPLTPSGKLERRALPEPVTHAERPPTASSPQTPTEQAVARIWTSALGLSQLGIRDDFFELGGDSLVAVRVAAEIEREFGRRLPLTSFFKGGTTVRSLSRVLERDLDAESSPLVVKAKSSGSLPPLFFIFSDESALLSLRHFLPAFDPEQPVYGLLPERIGRRFDRSRSVEDLGTSLLAVIQRIQPIGPYHLCGHSLGGLIAYDLGRQLTEAGDSVGFLGLVDTLTPAASVRWIKNWMNPRARMGRQFRRGFREGLAKLWEVADREARSAVGRVTTRWRLMAADQFDTDGAMAVGFRYRPHGYAGPLTVFWTEPGAEAADGPELGWSQPHRGPIECVRLPGDHLSMLQQPQVAEAAAALAERLHRAQGAADPDIAREPAAHLVASQIRGSLPLTGR